RLAGTGPRRPDGRMAPQRRRLADPARPRLRPPARPRHPAPAGGAGGLRAGDRGVRGDVAAALARSAPSPACGEPGMGARAAGARTVTRRPACPHPNPPPRAGEGVWPHAVESQPLSRNLPGMSHYEGDLRAAEGARFAIIASRWNPRITDALVAGARKA